MSPTTTRQPIHACRPTSHVEARNPNRSHVVEAMSKQLREHHPQLFGSDTLSSTDGVGVEGLYHGTTKLGCDVLVGSRGSISGSHEDYPLQAPSIIIVITGRKLVWIAPGPFRQLLSDRSCNKASADLLYRSLCTIDKDILHRLHTSFGGQLLELVPGEGAVVPPCRVHAAFNLEPTISVNYTVCSQDQWADTVECTVKINLEHRREAAFKAAAKDQESAGGSVPEADLSSKAEALLKTTTETGGRHSFEGCIVMFNYGFTNWVEERIKQDAANFNNDDKALDRLGRAARMLASGGGLDSVLSTGADAKWRKRMLSVIRKAGIA